MDRPYRSRKYANDLTVEAILLLSKKPFFNELNFTIVGDGALFDDCNKDLLNFENVILRKEFLTHNEIVELHKQHGIFLNPTRWDSQGISRDEAMASGLVAITNNLDAVSEFCDESCAMLVPIESAEAIADAIEKLYYNPDLFLQLSKAGAERVRTQSNFNNTIQREIDLINQFRNGNTP